MLQQEPQEENSALPAAQKRVTAEEMTSALNALEADKQREASRLAGTVAIGAVVEELNLDATPEQVWDQVQKQRMAAAEKAATPPPPKALQRAADEARKAAAQAVAAARTPAATRRRVRGWRDIQGWVWVLFWSCGGLGLVTGVLHSVHPNAAVSVSGDGQTLTSATLGKNVEVSGDNDTLTFQGNCPTLTINGDDNHVRVNGTVGRIVTDGDGNVVTYVSGQGAAPAISGDGDGNTVAPAP